MPTELQTTSTTELDAKDFTIGGDGAALAEGTIARFEAVITSKRLDRDGDTMNPLGANIDPAMPLLWQHNAELPIGKFTGVTSRDSEKVVGRFELADTPLGRDALVLLKMGALRISHGFRPIQFEPKKSGGFDIQSFEVVEASLVSVPANTDAIVTALQTGKFYSSTVKSWAGSLAADKGKTMPETKTPTDTKTSDKPNDQKSFSEDDVQKIVAKALGDFQASQGGGASDDDDDDAKQGDKKSTTPTGDDLLGAAHKGGAGNVVVKKASEQYSHSKSAGVHCKTGLPARDELGREAMLPSERENAKSGALLKFLAAKSGIGEASLDDHGRELIEESFTSDRWAGKMSGQYQSGINGVSVKALLNDSVSGGVEIVPEYFDSDLISFPLLYGELFPSIDLRPVPRGSSVEGASVGNPSVVWNTPEGTEISIFDTSSLIAAIDTSIHNVTCAIEVGRDFLADSPADVGRILLENVGMRMMEELDKVIAVGDGITQPVGIFTASGLSDLNSDNDTSGPPTLNDYESLLFGIGKQYRSAAMRCAFITNDTSYQRRTGIKIDAATPSTDQRPVMGMSHNDYSTLGWPHRIQNDIGNSKLAFGALAKYRMFRRQGMSVEWVAGGKELARRNVALLVVRARFGGQPVDANAFVTMSDAQS